MARWNNTLEQNCKDILDNVIKNLKPDLYQSLLLEVLDANIANSELPRPKGRGFRFHQYQ